jgi:hypothetical protein
MERLLEGPVIRLATTNGTGTRTSRRRFPAEVLATWALFAVVALAMLVTYSRLPASDLYHVSGGGLVGGASRVLVFSNFPLALVAIAVLAIVADRLASRAALAVAIVGVMLSAAVYWPGVVKESDLDARAVNAVAGIGVVVALGLTAVGALTRPLERPARQRGDVVRAVIAAIVLALSLPWAAADLGLHLDGVPALGAIFQTGELRSQPGVPGLHPAVHFGHHHGMDGALLVLSALLLSRVLGAIRERWLQLALAAYLALMLCYGAGNVANDFWLEQIVKRGWTDWAIPNVTTPAASVAWGVILAAAASVFAVGAWIARRPVGDAAAADSDLPEAGAVRPA